MIHLQQSYLVRSLLLTIGLVVAVPYARSSPGWGWTVFLAILVGVLSLQLRYLGERLKAAEGKQSELGLIRIVVLWVCALLMTVWLAEQDRGTWREWVGWTLGVLALAETLHLYLRERAAMRDCGEG